MGGTHARVEKGRLTALALPLTATLVLAGTSGCGEAPPPKAGTLAVPGAPAAVAPEPLAVAGETPGDTLHEFHQVTTPFALPDGRFVVPLTGMGVVRVFSGRGRFVESLGRPGQGPGEFSRIGSAWPRGDTVEVFDSRNRRVTRFLPDGSVRTVPLEPGAPAEVAVPGPFGDGWAVTGIVRIDREGRDRMALHHFAGTGEHLGELAPVEGYVRYTFPGGGSPIPLSPRAQYAVHGDRLFLGQTLEPALQVINTAGEVVDRIAWDPESVLDPQQAQRLVADSADLQWVGEEAAHRARIREAPLPANVPAYATLLVDSKGFLWIRPWDPLIHATDVGGLTRVGPGGTWRILSPEGEDLGTVEVPPELEPSWIGPDRVVGIRRDAYDVESVRVHELRRHR
jgi:hypothetical protein